MGLSICVYCSSNDAVDRAYFEVAEELGRELGTRGHTLVYGGASIGLMGAVARATQAAGGRVVGVIEETLRASEVAYLAADELVITRDMRERKAAMEAGADAFIALPGGFGTLDEMVETLTRKRLGLHRKALAWLNAGGFYDDLIALFDRMQRERFTKPEYAGLYTVVSTAAEALDAIEAH